MNREEAEKLIQQNLVNILNIYKMYAPENADMLSIAVGMDGYINCNNAYWDNDKNWEIRFSKYVGGEP